MKDNAWERFIQRAENSPLAMIVSCSVIGLLLGIMLYMAF